MTDDVGTSRATTNATPETSLAPRQGMDAHGGDTGNRTPRSGRVRIVTDGCAFAAATPPRSRFTDRTTASVSARAGRARAAAGW